MKLTTKSLLSSLVAAIINSVPSAYHTVSRRVAERYERILEKHDRKGELRAAVLGLDPVEFRKQERKHSLEAIVRTYGFVDEHAFYRALMGKIRDELHHRGWTSKRIQSFEESSLRRIEQ